MKSKKYPKSQSTMAALPFNRQWLWWSLVLTLIIVAVSVVIFYFVDSGEAAGFGDFFGGAVGTIFGIVSVLLILLTLHFQMVGDSKHTVGDQFFKMLDYHHSNVSELRMPDKNNAISEGRGVFIIFRSQLEYWLAQVKWISEKLELDLSRHQIIDIAYMAFFYGVDGHWDDFDEIKLEGYPRRSDLFDALLKKKILSECEFGRTNQVSLNVYFHNMYNAIKLVDSTTTLTSTEKKSLIEIYRAQLSNPELCVLYFYTISRFGMQWRSEMHNYITKYNLIKYLPRGYCGKGYDPSEDFPISYADDEYVTFLDK